MGTFKPSSESLEFAEPGIVLSLDFMSSSTDWLFIAQTEHILGSSLGQFFKQYLEPIKLNEVQVDWKSMDLSYLLEEKYTKHFADIVRKAKPVYGADFVLKAHNIEGDVRIKYKDQSDFENTAGQFGIFQEWKDGVPRTAYKGVVVFRHQTSRRIFLVGPESLRLLGIEDA
ncbi:alpha-1,3-mannosyl-glycoprotein 2-beta-N-acetylglucosaminyltransferase isoform X2 [Senna tora]|uniref:Alpha-1,3-mannosyl-glycoprotein 2-beta-N-acetylglucosaminyltransferase n=1 Tax=Senna tora TaxID=362788 RepID=A0A835CG41_9FABA|nr:alpha-1,3-mannosyl-glycoprotein 2-beta-N-acetylglucosaminyltransferase isoform X2 [Senna tora]